MAGLPERQADKAYGEAALEADQIANGEACDQDQGQQSQSPAGAKTNRCVLYLPWLPATVAGVWCMPLLTTSNSYRFACMLALAANSGYEF